MGGGSGDRAGGAARGLVQRAHFAAAALVGVLAFAFLSGAGLLLAAAAGRRALRPVVRLWSGLMRAVLGWRVEVDEPERLRREAPFVLVGNHQSILDLVVYGAFFPERTVTLGKQELSRIPLFGWFYVATGNVLLDRGNPARAIGSIREAAERVRREGLSVLAFPEGHRNGRPELLPFKRGPFTLAIGAGVPVVPVVVEPLGSLVDVARARVRPGRVRVRVLPEVETSSLAEADAEADAEALARRLRGSMQEALDELRSSAPARIS